MIHLTRKWICRSLLLANMSKNYGNLRGIGEKMANSTFASLFTILWFWYANVTFIIFALDLLLSFCIFATGLQGANLCKSIFSPSDSFNKSSHFCEEKEMVIFPAWNLLTHQWVTEMWLPLTWDHALFSFRLLNKTQGLTMRILKSGPISTTTSQNMYKLLKFGLISV